jgi:FkbM family methyltransferase
MLTIRDFGLFVVRQLPWLGGFGRRVYNALPRWFHDTPTGRVEMYFAGEETVNFIEIGAYDGVAGDPIRPLVVAKSGWQGVLVEPQPDIFVKLQQNYRHQAARLTFLNAAISDRTGGMDFYFVPPEERVRLTLPDWSGEVASFNREHIHRHFPEATIETRRVEAITFADAAAYLPDGRVDLVVMDVEGHERAILETIDFDRQRVRFLIYEHKHMAEVEARSIELMLMARGFSIKRFGRDTIGWRTSTQTVVGA